MKARFNRTVLALLLTMIAIAVPSVAWYIVGCREAEREAAAMRAQAEHSAHNTATLLAERVRTRLEMLREAEEKRPFYHYQNLYHDPKGAYEGISVHPSPLAEGPNDPMIRAYFQIDAAGRLSLPTLNEEVQETSAQQELAPQRAIRKELESAVASSREIFQPGQTVNSIVASQQPADVPRQSSSISQTQSSASQVAQSVVARRAQGNRVETLEPEAWAQNAAANDVYANLKHNKLSQPEQKQALQQYRGGKGNVQIGVGSLEWHTVPVAGAPTLVALREVTTPQGSLIQGMAMAVTTIEDSLKGAAFPARFTLKGPVHPGQVAVPIGDTEWQVVVDAGPVAAQAIQRAREVRATFLQFFFGGVAAASVAGLCVVGLVWQTERLARQRSQFAASAAHELRTPLAGLRMYSEMLAEGLGDPTRAKDYARRVADEAERLGRVVANVLGFTRLERGTLKAQPEPGDLAAAVRDCVARQQPAIEAAGGRLDVQIAEEMPHVKFDRDAVAEIMQNLLDNAEKHTRAAKNRTIHVTMNRTDGRVVLSVTDHGPGIPAETQRRMFRAFERGNHADTPAGLGLGLVVVQALARAQGGQVTYSDTPGGGAVFTVTFPA